MDWLKKFNRIFESKIRLGIMSVLAVNESLSFNELKELLRLTDGNLASHLRALEDANYLAVQKQFIGRKPLTTYKSTVIGQKAFAEHLTILESIIQQTISD
jgi:DNA-binding MarR family transcriptional regulator